MAQLINITSEALQSTIRRLLPSQQGFGEDLQASNVITPIIDLTPTAEGSEVRQDLQTALSHGSITPFSVSNTTTTLVNSPGFYRVYGVASNETQAGGNTLKFELSDGFSTKKFWQMQSDNNSGTASLYLEFDFVVFLDAGESLTATTDYSRAALIGSTYQIADKNGNLQNPSGFNPQ